MNQTAIIHDYRRQCLGFLAWACFTLCAGIVLGTVAIAVVCSTTRSRGLDPLPQVRWDDVRSAK